MFSGILFIILKRKCLITFTWNKFINKFAYIFSYGQYYVAFYLVGNQGLCSLYNKSKDRFLWTFKPRKPPDPHFFNEFFN